jgi:acyl-coenzyme A thioesterase PaaI-like protein
VDANRVKKTPAIQKLIQKKPRWSSLTLDVLKGNKTVHLKPGTRLSDIATIEGEVSIQLPSHITKKRINAPFKNKIVQAGELRIKMKKAASDTVSFIASGNVNHLIETRALNDAGKYLQSGSSMSSGLFFGKGSNKNKQFRGKPKTVEFVIARKTSRKTYPFKFKFQRPAYPASPFFKPISVETQSRRSFLNQRVSTPKRRVCSSSSIEFQSRPFYICLNQRIHIQSKWKQPGKYVMGSFLVHSTDAAAITNNLSAAQLNVEKVFAKNGNSPTVKTLLMKDAKFLNLNANYVSPLKGDQLRIEAGPVKEEDENLTPVGFEGHLKIRLPRKLSSFRLDLFSLGSSAQSSNGLKAKFTGISEKGIRMEIEGPRETLVQFIPLNLRGKPLTQKDPRIEKIESDGKTIWQAEVQAPPETRYMDIVFAPQQDTWDIPFHLEK